MLRVLGEVEACVGGRVVDLGHPKQRCVLAVLIVARGRPVPIDILVDRVWGAAAPSRGRETVHSHLSRLRQALGAGDVSITRRPGGYTVDSDESTVDLYAFWDACATAIAENDDSRVVTLLTGALALWRGRALAGLPGEWAEAERERLGRERLAARTELAEARLRLGEGARLVPELEAFAAEHPYDERIARLCMTALHRAGRTADALGHYRGIRVRLADDLGVDPAEPLAALHQELLGTHRSVTTVPRQLPLAIRDFTGREDHLAAPVWLLSLSDHASNV
ncbi:BTAD domain-containing putative transcriptional regulator [Amycolatopsis sp. NPDC005232]|uniref:AfsR/SARP family transcriptional regulator n=1 Tax=Amycolatopsis sp. NPDC005232 TaxID=3157027 RepID=UPI0033B9600A